VDDYERVIDPLRHKTGRHGRSRCSHPVELVARL
jgi:hypothetical protein